MTVRVVAVLVGVTLAVLVVLEVPLAISYRHQRTTAVSTELERDALTIGDLIEDHLERGEAGPINSVVKEYQEQRDARAVVVDHNGALVADSDPPAGTSGSGRSFATRPEVAAALEGRTVSVTRRSETLDESLRIVAAPVRSGSQIFGVVRVSRPLHALQHDVLVYDAKLLVVALVALGVAAGLGWLVGQWATGALGDLRRAAVQLEGGDLDSRADGRQGPPEVRDLAERFNAMATRLALLVRSSQQFAADASHQLRTPLTALRLRLENLEAHDGPPDELGTVLDDIERLETTIDALLAFTRLEQLPPSSDVVSLSPFLDERAELWSGLCQDRGITVRAVPTDLSVHFDANHLEQVVDNLIANAADASPSGAEIELRAENAPPNVQLHVIDHGPGLDEESRAKAFDRLWTSSADGNGLGLAIVARLCEANGAEVRLDAASSGGIDAVVTASPTGTTR